MAGSKPKALVEAIVKKGKDGRYGVTVGRWPQEGDEHDADWISTGGDRFEDKKDAIHLIKTYWPTGVCIIDPEEDERNRERRRKRQRDLDETAMNVSTMA